MPLKMLTLCRNVNTTSLQQYTLLSYCAEQQNSRVPMVHKFHTSSTLKNKIKRTLTYNRRRKYYICILEGCSNCFLNTIAKFFCYHIFSDFRSLSDFYFIALYQNLMMKQVNIPMVIPVVKRDAKLSVHEVLLNRRQRSYTPKTEV